MFCGECEFCRIGRPALCTEGTRIRSIVGINHDGVFGSTRKGWRPDLPDACTECDEHWPVGSTPHEYCYLGDETVPEDLLIGWPWV